MNTCHYCGSDKVVDNIIVDRETLQVVCTECEKATSLELKKSCRGCGAFFVYSYDYFLDGGFFNPICMKCRLKKLKDYMESPEVQEGLKEAFKAYNPKNNWLGKLMEEDKGWKGGTIKIPFTKEEEK